MRIYKPIRQRHPRSHAHSKRRTTSLYSPSLLAQRCATVSKRTPLPSVRPNPSSSKTSRASRPGTSPVPSHASFAQKNPFRANHQQRAPTRKKKVFFFPTLSAQRAAPQKRPAGCRAAAPAGRAVAPAGRAAAPRPPPPLLHITVAGRRAAASCCCGLPRERGGLPKGAARRCEPAPAALELACVRTPEAGGRRSLHVSVAARVTERAELGSGVGLWGAAPALRSRDSEDARLAL